MKFILRDDDVNYHYEAKQLEEWYRGITDICPISMCIPAFIKGDFFKWVTIFQNHIPYNDEEWLADNQIHKIGENKELTNLIRSLIAEKKVSISMHGIIHRNEEMDIPPVKNNFIRGAEFYTNRDYSNYLSEAKKYLEDLFDVDICSFSPPQNMINKNGLKALYNNRLSLCTDFISLVHLGRCIETYGLSNTFSLMYYKIFGHHIYPYVINREIDFVGHIRLQPHLSLDKIKTELDFVYKKNGVFVLSTHSYGFDHKMTQYNMTMKDGVMEILNFTQQYCDVEYTTLHDLFHIKK